MVILLLVFRVLIIKQRSKAVDYFIVIFFWNVRCEKPKIQSLILLPPQWHHFFGIGSVDYLLL